MVHFCSTKPCFWKVKNEWHSLQYSWIHSKLRSYRIILGLKTINFHPYKHVKIPHTCQHIKAHCQHSSFAHSTHPGMLNHNQFSFWSTLHNIDLWLLTQGTEAGVWLGHFSIPAKVFFSLPIWLSMPRAIFCSKDPNPILSPWLWEETQVTGISCYFQV